MLAAKVNSSFKRNFKKQQLQTKNLPATGKFLEEQETQTLRFP